MPETLSKDRVEEYFNEKIKPLLDRYGATVVTFDPEAHLKVGDFDAFTPLVFEKNGEQVSVGGGMFRPISVEWLLKRWDEVQAIVDDLKGSRDPFHSDIWRQFKTRWPDARQRQMDDLAYLFVCRKLQALGITIHSD